MLIEGSKRYVRSADVPDVDTEVHQYSTAGYVEAPLGAPLDTPNTSYGLHIVTVLDRTIFTL